jgi:hypothetical protein
VILSFRDRGWRTNDYFAVWNSTTILTDVWFLHEIYRQNNPGMDIYPPWMRPAAARVRNRVESCALFFKVARLCHAMLLLWAPGEWTATLQRDWCLTFHGKHSTIEWWATCNTRSLSVFYGRKIKWLCIELSSFHFDDTSHLFQWKVYNSVWTIWRRQRVAPVKRSNAARYCHNRLKLF